MAKKYSLLIIFSLFSFYSIAQDEYDKNAVYFELLGNAGIYSFNYERAFSPNFNLRVGFGTSSGGWYTSGDTYIQVFPVMGNYLFGNGNNRFELGGGILVGSKEVDYGLNAPNNLKITIFDLTGLVGYRYQKPQGGFLFRVGATPFIALTGGEDAYPEEGISLSGGVSLGYVF